MHLPPGNILKLTEQSFLLYLVHGITAVRALGDGTSTADPAAREALARGVPGWAAGKICVTPEKLRALREATAKRGMALSGHVPYGLDYVAGDVPEVQHYFAVPKPSFVKRDHLVWCGW